MDFMKTMAIAASGLRAQASRMRVISENIANADSTASKPGDDPYRRKMLTFKNHFDRELGVNEVAVGRIVTDQSDFRLKHEPGNPVADKDGNVKYPNVNSLIEITDMREAQRSYEANVNLITATRRMLQRTIDILKT